MKELNKKPKNGVLADHEPQRLKINCFYKCPFTASESPLMEKHYRKEHYKKEAISG